jgi:hypothetical protein
LFLRPYLLFRCRCCRRHHYCYYYWRRGTNDALLGRQNVSSIATTAIFPASHFDGYSSYFREERDGREPWKTLSFLLREFLCICPYTYSYDLVIMGRTFEPRLGRLVTSQWNSRIVASNCSHTRMESS